MSANGKRPFYVFAAVAAICSMVLVGGMRGSKAEPADPHHTASPPVVGAGAPLSPSSEAPGGVIPPEDDEEGGGRGSTGPIVEADFDLTTPQELPSGGDTDDADDAADTDALAGPPPGASHFDDVIDLDGLLDGLTGGDDGDEVDGLTQARPGKGKAKGKNNGKDKGKNGNGNGNGNGNNPGQEPSPEGPVSPQSTPPPSVDPLLPDYDDLPDLDDVEDEQDDD